MKTSVAIPVVVVLTAALTVIEEARKGLAVHLSAERSVPRGGQKNTFVVRLDHQLND